MFCGIFSMQDLFSVSLLSLMADIIDLCVGGQNSSSGTPEGESAR